MRRAPGLGRAAAGAARGRRSTHGRRAVALGDRAGHRWWAPVRAGPARGHAGGVRRPRPRPSPARRGRGRGPARRAPRRTCCAASRRWPRRPGTRRRARRGRRAAASASTRRPAGPGCPGRTPTRRSPGPGSARGAPGRAREVARARCWRPPRGPAGSRRWPAAGLEDGARHRPARRRRRRRGRRWTGPGSWRGRTACPRWWRPRRRRSPRSWASPSRRHAAAAQPRRNGGDDAGRARLTLSITHRTEQTMTDRQRPQSPRRRWTPTGSTSCSAA